MVKTLSDDVWNDGEEGCHNMYYEKDVKEFIKTICVRIIAKQGATDYIQNGNDMVKFIEDKSGFVLVATGEGVKE